MLEIEFHPEVQFEVLDSYRWYEEKSQGLGDDFINELESSFQTIIEFPDTWPIFKKGFRRFLLSRFPFSIIYRRKQNTVFVIAIMNQYRKPGYWLNRT